MYAIRSYYDIRKAVCKAVRAAALFALAVPLRIFQTHHKKARAAAVKVVAVKAAAIAAKKYR